MLPDLRMKGAYNIFLGPGVTVTLQRDSSCATFYIFTTLQGSTPIPWGHILVVAGVTNALQTDLTF